MEWLNFIQWPAMVVTITATWFTASQHKMRRKIGFWMFLLSNVLWVAWGWYDHAWALVLLQVGLAAMNFRGVHKNETDSPAEP